MTTTTTFGYHDLPALMTRMTGDEKHSTSATSTLDVLWVLYDRVLCVDPADPVHPDRDRFLLSKGHGPVAYYAVLAAKGFVPVHALDDFGGYESIFGHHPDRTLIPGVEISSGSLGHGLPIAVGQAVALDIHRSEARVFCLLGDGELDEGSNHEAIAFAARYGLDRLTAIVIDNGSATHGWPGGIASRFTVEGWTAFTVDGRDHAELERVFNLPHADGPHVVVATIHGAA